MVEYFRDFRELHRNHENFLTQPLSTGLHTSKSRNNDESRKSAKITKIFNHENLELYGICLVTYVCIEYQESTVVFTGLKITVGHRSISGQISNVATNFLVCLTHFRSNKSKW